MNKVEITGRLTRDPEVRYTEGENAMCVARFALAVDRKVKTENRTADFINCVAFGKSGQFVEKYFSKGMKVGIIGRLQSDSYTNKDGQKVYVTNVVCEELEFEEKKESGGSSADDGFMNVPEGIDEDLPFAQVR